MRILLWHVHGSWTTAFVQGRHEYVLPVDETRTAWGLGRARTWDWPASVREEKIAALRELDFDAVLLQRPDELDLAHRWTGRRPGRELPAVYVEHNAPHGGGDAVSARHPLAERADIPLVHVTSFNELYWDNGRAPTHVVEHGVLDPGPLWTGEFARAATAINEPVRRGRVVGTDLLADLATVRGLDVYGMGVRALPSLPGVSVYEDLPQDLMHVEIARRRVFVHTARWTSLGLSLIEAMMLGMPVVVVAGAEAAVSVPTDAGVVTTSRPRLAEGIAAFVDDPGAAKEAGAAARRHALQAWNVERFLADWDRILTGLA